MANQDLKNRRLLRELVRVVEDQGSEMRILEMGQGTGSSMDWVLESDDRTWSGNIAS